MSRQQEGDLRCLPGIRHCGTEAFGKRVLKRRNKKKAASKARKRNRRK